MANIELLAGSDGATATTANRFRSFDGIQIAYHDQGEGPAVILLHGFGVGGLDQFGSFERVLPLVEKRQEMFGEVFGGRNQPTPGSAEHLLVSAISRTPPCDSP